MAEITILPGQEDAMGRRVGALTFSGAVAVVRERVREVASRGEPFRVLGISFGCAVALKAILDSPEAAEMI